MSSFSFSSFFHEVTKNVYPIELILAFILAILIALGFGYTLGYLINRCQNNSSSPVDSTTARTDGRHTQTGGAPYADNAQQSASATIPETSSVQPPQSETAIPPLHSPLPSKDMHASTSHAQSAIANTRTSAATTPPAIGESHTTASAMNQSSIELTPTSEDQCKSVERFYSSRGFISRFVDDYKVDCGELENTSTENASSAIGNAPPTTGEDIQLERYLSARGEVGDDNEVENSPIAIGNTPPATGEHIDLERYLSARGEIGDDIETDD